MLHVWYIYLQNWVILRANVGVHIPAPWVAYGNGSTQNPPIPVTERLNQVLSLQQGCQLLLRAAHDFGPRADIREMIR